MILKWVSKVCDMDTCTFNQWITFSNRGRSCAQIELRVCHRVDKDCQLMEKDMVSFVFSSRYINWNMAKNTKTLKKKNVNLEYIKNQQKGKCK